MIFYILFPLVVLALNMLIKKNKFFISNFQLNHQKFINVQVPLVGGYLLVFPILFLFYKVDFLFSVICVLMFLLGTFSDFNILSSPKKRFLIQFLLILIFVFVKQLEVFPTRISYIDENFTKTYWSYLFTVFCLMILINGSNFIDGLNGLLLGYFIIILLIINKLNLLSNFNLSDNQFHFLIYTFVIVYFFNFFNQFFLGDSGAYFLSFFIGSILIKIYNISLEISPYFIILLIWYPCFENLFSIIRKLKKKKSVLKPDNGHLHQTIFLLIKQKFNLKNLLANVISGLLINLFNLILLYIGSLDPNNTMFQLNLILIAIFSYLIIYTIIRKNIDGSVISSKK
jgi:UDP-N-acetylmuramyl pentapeptide phosphotransferase/UDP-N-acetylglucosamine-1-phosphate transferase